MAADQILRLALAPLLLAQGLWVRMRALKLPEPPGPRSGARSGPRTATRSGPHSGGETGLRLLILGDSSAAGVGATHQSKALSGQLAAALAAQAPLTWHLEAETGATTKTSLAKCARLPDTPFDAALLVHGVNDTTRFTSRTRFHARQSALIETLRRRHAVRHVILSGLPPMHHFPLLPQPLRWVLGCHAQRLDAVLADIAANDPDITHLPLNLPYEPRFVAVDGFHPSEDAYTVWAQLLSDTIAAQRRAP